MVSVAHVVVCIFYAVFVIPLMIILATTGTVGILIDLLIISLTVFYLIPILKFNEHYQRQRQIEIERLRKYESRLQRICKHLTRLSSVVIKCQCGLVFLRTDLGIEGTYEATIQKLKEQGYPTTMKCPRCGKTIVRTREPSGVCALDGKRVSREQLFNCLMTSSGDIKSKCAARGSKATIVSKATANSEVSIYWDDSLIGKTTTDRNGAFTFQFTIPLDATLGIHMVKVLDSAGKKGLTSFKVRS